MVIFAGCPCFCTWPFTPRPHSFPFAPQAPQATLIWTEIKDPPQVLRFAATRPTSGSSGLPYRAFLLERTGVKRFYLEGGQWKSYNYIFTSSILLDHQWSTYHVIYWWYSSDSWLYIRDSTRVRWTVTSLSTFTASCLVSSRFFHQHLDEDSNVRQWFKSPRFGININIMSFNIMMNMLYKNYYRSLSVNIIHQDMRMSFTKLNIVQYVG